MEDFHPYRSYEDALAWKVVDEAVAALVENHDIKELTTRTRIVGYLVKQLIESGVVMSTDAASMAVERFQEGDRIRIAASYHWAQGATGTISVPPEFVQGPEAGHAWQGLTCSWKSPIGKIYTHYWVCFDEPQYDADGDGPYKEGGIDEEAIELLDDTEETGGHHQ